MMFVIVALSIIVVLQGVLILILDTRWRKTTDALMDRVQAKDLIEYKKVQPPEPKKEKKPEPKKEDELTAQL